MVVVTGKGKENWQRERFTPNLISQQKGDGREECRGEREGRGGKSSEIREW